MALIQLDRTTSENVFAGEVPPGLRGRWCAFWVRTRRSVCTLRLSGDPEARGGPNEKYLLPVRFLGISLLIQHVPEATRQVELGVFGTKTPPAACALHAMALGKTMAAMLLLAGNPLHAVAALPGNPRTLAARLRAAATRIANTRPSPATYATWVRLFDSWTAQRLNAPAGTPTPRVLALVLHTAGTPAAALAATLHALRASVTEVTVLTHDPGAGTPFPDMSTCDQDYIAIIQAGEIIPAHAFALAGRFIAAQGRPALLMADEDVIDRTGTRCSPLFKPQPHRALMLSGLLSRGLWLVRRDVLAAAAPAGTAWAETLRLELWLRLQEAGRAGSSTRILHILAHRRADTPAAPPSAIARSVAGHLERCGLAAQIDARRFPVTVRLLPGRVDKVAIVIPSSCRAPHVLRCLPAIIAATDWPDFEVLVVVSQQAEFDRQQLASIKVIAADRRVRILRHTAESFNYSAVNNHAVTQTDAEFICLVNDDILPLASDWLAALMGNLSDPGVAAVGAKLLYADRTIQHGGVIMGLGGLCEHAFRYLPQAAAGHAGRALLDQDVSAVTGACLLVRRAVYDAVGGLDEAFPARHGDIDLCLKIRALGQRIVWSAQARLLHFESLSFARHQNRDQAARESAEATIMWNRWREVCEDDPCYNPNLSLVLGSAWTPAFPPRVP